MSIDRGALLRRYKPEKRLEALVTRERSEFASLTNLRVGDRPRLLVDTGFYIARAAGVLRSDQRDVLARTEVHHCTVCFGEIAVGLANRDVTAVSWPAECAYWRGLFRAIPANRVHAPDAEIWAAAGIVAGTLTRLQGFQPHQRKDALNDALIFLTATKGGLPVLTENRRDFDWMQQLVPEGRLYLL